MWGFSLALLIRLSSVGDSYILPLSHLGDTKGKRSNKGIFWEESLFPNGSSLYIVPQEPHEFLKRS